ncbi:hypothetical protein ACH5RR_000771 [Cinchona calisaya]|uniref:DDE Tnp4 domain-containing protein n=1 Tax=Cinchona calisaya TaxID=153742 RepID=A0ABD3B1J9_9GENT
MFVYVFAHHKKNRTVAHKCSRSGEAVSRYFNQCLLAVLKLHHMLLKTPVPISDDCTDDHWKYFKNCLGALDGTLISVALPAEHKSRYRTGKSNLATNVSRVCAQDMQFICVLPGWEGFAHDGHVLRDAISIPNGLKVVIIWWALVIVIHKDSLHHIEDKDITSIKSKGVDQKVLRSIST